MWFLPNKPGSYVVDEEQLKQAVDPDGAAVRDQSSAEPVQAPERTVYDESQALYVTLIFFTAITLRVMLLVLGPYGDSERAMYPDSYRYVELGETLISDGVFARSGAETGVVHEPLAQLRTDFGQNELANKAGLRPEIMRTPGYPALIGAVVWTGLGVNGLLAVQCLFGAFCVVLVYGIGRTLIKRPGPALFAALIVALHPADIAAPTAVLTETVFTLMVLLGLWSVADHEKRNIGTTTFGGMMIGLSVLVRPVSIFLGPAVALWMIATDRRLKTLMLATLMTALSLAPGAAWMARNKSIGFGYRLSSIPYINSYFYTDAYMRITDQGGDWKDDWPATVDTLMGELRAEMNLNPDTDAFSTMKALSLEAVRGNPSLYGRVMRESVLKFFTDHSMGGLYQQLGLTYTPTGLRDRLMTGGLSPANLSEMFSQPTGIIALAWAGLNGLLLVGMVLGGVILLVRGHWSALLLLGGVMLYFTFATQTTGLERFRLPVLGVQALLVASIFAPRFPRKKKESKPKRRWYEQEEDSDETDGDETTQSVPDPLQEPEPEALARPL